MQMLRQLVSVLRYRAAFVNGAQFYAEIGKIVSELQACGECLHEHSIFQLRYSVDFEDVTFGGRIIRKGVIHDDLPHRPPADLLEQGIRQPSQMFNFYVNFERIQA